MPIARGDGIRPAKRCENTLGGSTSRSALQIRSQFAENVRNHRAAAIHLLGRDIQRWEESYDRFVSRIDQYAALHAFAHHGCGRHGQIDTDH